MCCNLRQRSCCRGSQGTLFAEVNTARAVAAVAEAPSPHRGKRPANLGTCEGGADRSSPAAISAGHSQEPTVAAVAAPPKRVPGPAATGASPARREQQEGGVGPASALPTCQAQEPQEKVSAEEQLVGRRLKVYWAENDAWYTGTISGFTGRQVQQYLRSKGCGWGISSNWMQGPSL